ncbi:Multimerin-2 [Saguinus oedipus]|uniref:Multimerin-2 n=1 Tax=Saguinus oedipus TaxID=9490 RepID=A0ABQ9VYM8_SAGOE|nr:Multimerin-2 [Saguinus oedipus]
MEPPWQAEHLEPVTTQAQKRPCEALAKLAQELQFLRSALGIHHQVQLGSTSLELPRAGGSNINLNLGRLQAMPSEKGKQQQKGPEVPWKRDWKEAEPLADTHIKGLVPGALNTKLWQADSPVAFYASFSEGTGGLQTLQLNTTYINTGSSYFPEHGYYQARVRCLICCEH